MVVAEEITKPSLKMSMSDSESASSEESDNSDDDVAAIKHITDPESVSSDDSGDDQHSDNELLVINKGWADSVTKILSSSKPKNKKTLVLSRAKKYSEVIKKDKEEKPAFEIIGETKKVQVEVKKEEKGPSEPPAKKKKNENQSLRVKPNILEKDRERLLTKIATKGVVQLFNAVRNQQKTLDKELNRSDLPESKKEKILKKFDKRTFLDSLMGPTKSIIVDEVKPQKKEIKDEEQPRWSALRDDFMMGAKMKDWDKESVDE